MQEGTKRQQTRTEGERPEEQLALRESALAVTAEGVTISDPSQPDNPIIYANAGFERLTGYSIDDVVGRNCRFLQGPDTDTATVQRIRDAIKNEEERTVQLLNYRKNGTPFWNRLSITPLRNAAGEVTHFVGVQSDITDQKRAEEALRQVNKQLESANERMARDLEAAAEIQRSLLPSSAPDIPGVTFSWAFRPCDELAGDILNVGPLDSGHIALYVIDVSGHGVASALFAVTLCRLLSVIPGESSLFAPDEEEPSGHRIVKPARVAEKLNRQFPFDPRTRQYFTMLYGVLDLETHQFHYVSAGQAGPVFVPQQGQPVDLTSSGFPIGLLSSAEYEERVVALAPGDRLYLVTDGITEAENEQGQEFGMAHFLGAIDRMRNLPLDEANHELIREVESWCGNVGMRDDASILACQISSEKA
ncbi:MAG: SpoIIE family protein phosphatase [Acidobacteria bacterium]|nr:SpoIIE family protein phosphatase [Acidobacteriota bacterium]